MPYFRHSSATLAPASASFRMPMICSSVNRFFMLPPLRQTLIQFRTILGEQVSRSPVPALFVIEVKHHQVRHGRPGFGGKNGGGFQPEILSGNFAYFENNLRWILASYKYPNKLLFLSSGALKKYLAGGKVG